MRVPTRLAATLATAAVLAAAAPAGAMAAMPALPHFGPDPNLCLKGVADPGPLGPSGPYGSEGPWGPDGPMHGQPNPMGDVASCGGALTYVLRGGTLTGFVQANLNAFGH